MMKKIYFLIAMVFCSAGVWGQMDITSTGTPFTENFDIMGTSGIATLPTGFKVGTDWATGVTATTLAYGTTGTGVVTGTSGGGIINWANGVTASATDRSLGFLNSGSFSSPRSIILSFTNNTGVTITSLDIVFDYEKSRSGTRQFDWTFFHGNTSTATTAATAGDQSYAGNANNTTIFNPPTATNKTFSLTGLSIANGTSYYLRWTFTGLGGSTNGQGIGVDNFSITAASGGATPDIVLSSPNPAVTAGNIQQGSTSLTNNPIYRFDLAVTTADATLNGVTINTAGTYTAADITNFKCWYSSDAIFSPGTDVLLSTLAPVAAAGPQVFLPFTNQGITNGTTGYMFITSDLPCTATIGNDISVNAITTADISFVSGNKSGTAFDGGLQTITAATPNDVTTPAASVANASSLLTWTDPAGCYDEVLIVARAVLPNDGIPTGDGSAYTGNLVFGLGTPLGSGFVVYNGPSVSGQPVSGLINGVTYFYKFFTRFGTTWTTGVEVSATPDIVTSPTDYFRTIATGDWATLAIWESSTDSISWIPATIIPGALAAHVVVQSPDSVWLSGLNTTANLTIMSGAKFNANTFSLTALVRFNLLGTASYYQGGTGKLVPGVEQVLAPTSNYHFNGTQDGTANLPYPEFGNLIWEPAASAAGTFQNITLAPPFNQGLVVRGDLTINIQGPTVREIRFATGVALSRTHTIDGDLNIISGFSTVVAQNGSNLVTSIVNIGGNLNISAGIFQGTSSSPATTGNAIVNIAGNINNTGGTIQTGASTAGLSSINYVGTTPQSINNSGGTFNFTANQRDTINNATGLTLNTPLTYNGNIQFTSGIVTTTATNLLTMGAGSSVTGASNTSYVRGPMKKIGNTPFVFPVGQTVAPDGGFAQIGIGNIIGGLATDEFIAEYIRGSARTLGPITAIGLDHVSGCDYWILDKIGGTPTVDITCYWSSNNTCGGAVYVTSLPDLVIAHFNGTSWDAFGTVGTATGTPAAGNVVWTGVSTFSPFSLGSVNFANPLPITIEYFTGAKQNGNHFLNWKVTCVSTPHATLELQRSSDGSSYATIYSIFATALRCQQPFDHTDNQPAKGINYYRLKMTGADGKVSYSSIVSLINATKGMEILNIAPNPIVNKNFTVRISAAEKMQMEMVITDMQGRVLQKLNTNLAAGFNTIPVSVRNLAAGTYQLVGNTAEGRTRVLRFVIQ